jgi:O-antigen/teichoic acid export membrane protein
MMVTIASILLTQVARIGNPVTAHLTAGAATNSQRIRFLMKYVGLMVAITIPVSMPAIIAPKFILETFFRPEYVSAAPVLRIMGIYVFIVAVDLVATQYVLSARMEKSYLLIVLSGNFASILLCLILIPSGGAVGAAWALLISHGILISLYWTRIRFSLKN